MTINVLKHRQIWLRLIPKQRKTRFIHHYWRNYRHWQSCKVKLKLLKVEQIVAAPQSSMTRKLSLLPLNLLILIGVLASTAASAKQRCEVIDSTGTPLNVRNTPDGSVVNTLERGRVIDSLEVRTDSQGRPWARVGNFVQGRYQVLGWVFKEFISCGDAGLVIPPNATLHSPTRQVSPTQARFKGNLWVTGTLVAQWIDSGDPRNLPKRKLQYSLIPDNPFRLPRFIPYTFDIQINTDDKLIQTAFGDAAAGRLLHKQVNAAQVHGRFLITNYVTGVICDSGWARADLLHVEINEQVIAHSVDEHKGC